MTMRRKVLLVEDDAMVRRFLDGLLRKPGWDVTVAATGREALIRLTEMRFDAILCDFDLGPGPNGLDILRDLPPPNTDAPLVMLTAHGTIDRCRDALLHGARDFVEKPSTPAEIVSRLECAWNPEAAPTVPATDGEAGWQDTIGDRHVRSALRMIERRFRDPEFSVDALAKSIGVTPDHLARLFRRHLGSGPLEQIHRTRIRAAGQLLEHSALSIYEVALESGYRATTDLDEWFGRFRQMTPSEWRTRRRE